MSMRCSALPIGNFNGQSVTLGQIARFEPVFEDGVIWRRDRLPTIAVRGDPVGNTQPDTIIAALAPQVDAFKAQLPPGFRLEVGGPVESSAKANAAIGASWPLILITTFTLLMLQLGNFSRSLLVVLTAPLGIIGVAIALLVSGQPMGFVALLGIISLAGMIMRNSVILVDQIQQDVARGLSQWDAIIESTVRRMRPITPHRSGRGAGDDSAVALDILGADGVRGDGRAGGGDFPHAVFSAGLVCGVVQGSARVTGGKHAKRNDGISAVLGTGGIGRLRQPGLARSGVAVLRLSAGLGRCSSTGCCRSTPVPPRCACSTAASCRATACRNRIRSASWK